MKETFKRLLTNGIMMCNNLAAIFYVLGAMPFFMFAPKYLEIMFAQSAAFASIISGKPNFCWLHEDQRINDSQKELSFVASDDTQSILHFHVLGTVGLACSAVGILLSGVVLSKYKPRARPLAAWNVFCGFVMVSGVIMFSFLECSKSLNENSFSDVKQ